MHFAWLTYNINLLQPVHIVIALCNSASSSLSRERFREPRRYFPAPAPVQNALSDSDMEAVHLRTLLCLHHLACERRIQLPLPLLRTKTVSESAATDRHNVFHTCNACIVEIAHAGVGINRKNRSRKHLFV